METISVALALLAMVCWGAAPVFSKLGLVSVDPFLALALGKFTDFTLTDKKSYLFRS